MTQKVSDLRGVLAIVTARGGSKGLPRKNVRPLAGRPLIDWTIAAGLQANCVDRLIISTDDAEIAETARAAGADVPFLRPPHLASDTASSADVLRHALEACPGYQTLVLLQPTSPLRSAADIDAAYQQMVAQSARSIIAVTQVTESPWLMFNIVQNGRLDRLLPVPDAASRRQDLPQAYRVNGALYFQSVETFTRTGQLVDEDTCAYVMGADAAIDIDTLADFERAEQLMQQRLGGGSVR